jgi:hypothetical protein
MGNESDEEDEAPVEVCRAPLALTQRVQNPETRAASVLTKEGPPPSSHPRPQRATMPPSVAAATAASATAMAAQREYEQKHLYAPGCPYAQYGSLLHQAATEDLTDVEGLRVVYRAGTDAQGRQIIVLVGQHLPAMSLPLDKFLRYMIRVMDGFVDRPYVLVYLHSDISDNQPALGWLRTVYSVFPLKYQLNLHRLFVVYPTFWLRLFLAFVTSFAIVLPVQYVDDLRELFSIMDHNQLAIPLDIIQRDPSVQVKKEGLHEDL